MAEVGADGSFNCGEITAAGLPVGEGIPSEEDLFASLNCQRGALQRRVMSVCWHAVLAPSINHHWQRH
jgi:hypothetical protein